MTVITMPLTLRIECRRRVSAIVEQSIYCRPLAYGMIRILRPSQERWSNARIRTARLIARLNAE